MHGFRDKGRGFVNAVDVPAPCEGVQRGENVQSRSKYSGDDWYAAWYVELTPEEFIEFLRTQERVIVEFNEETTDPWPTPLITIYDDYVE